MQIQAALLREKAQPFSIEQVEIDAPQAGEVLVRIVGAGICHTDMVIRDLLYPPPLPSVLGHEGAGVVEQIGPGVRKVQPGDHVVLSFQSCGQCINCQQGHPAYCDNFFAHNLGGVRADGTTTLCNGHGPVYGSFFGQSSFATYALATERNVVKVRQDAPLELLGPLGCGIQTGAGAVLNSLQARAGTSIAIFGTGSVGLSAVMAAGVAGCTTIIAVDINPARLQLAGELGATHIIHSGKHDPVEKIRQITGSGADYSLETTAQPKVFRQAVDSLRSRGVCGLIGAAAPGTEVSFDMTTILAGRTVLGVMEGDSVPDIFIPRLVDLYMQGRFPIDRLVTFYQLTEINRAMDDSEQGRTIKPILRMAA